MLLTRDQGREFFKGLSYADITGNDIMDLIKILVNELEKYKNSSEHGKQMGMSVAVLRKKDIKILKNEFKAARIQVNGSYFSRREAVTFSETGFIGFGGELDDKNVQPILRAFKTWCGELKGRIKQ